MNSKKTKKRKWKKILLLLIITWGICALLPRSDNFGRTNPLRIEEGKRPLLIAHGGGNHEFPDNTLEAFYNAYSVDPKVMMETDVSITKDGVVILSHDLTLDRKTSLRYATISDINYSDLMSQQIDFGYENPVVDMVNTSGTFVKYKNYLGEEVTPLDVTYPNGVSPRHESKFLATTLEELIISFPNNYINVEIKQEGEIGKKALKEVLRLMDELDSSYHTYDRIVLASFHRDIYKELIRHHKENSKLMFSPETVSVTKFYVLQLTKLDAFYKDKVAVLQLPMKQAGFNLAKESIVKASHDHNIAVHYWTIDQEEDMRHLIKIGADGIMTNRPSVLKKVLDEVFH